MENPIQMDNLGGTPIFGNTHVDSASNSNDGDGIC